MKWVDRSPLAHRLTRRVIIIQLLTLLVFFGAVVFPTVVLPILLGVRDSSPLDPKVVAIFGESVVAEDDQRLSIVPQQALQQLLQDHPTIWFLAQDDFGNNLSFGALPPEAEGLRPLLNQIISLQVTVMQENAPESLIVRTLPIGKSNLRIATGGGPRINPSAMVQIASVGIAVGTFLVLALASGLTVPRMIRRDMRGLSNAAEAAETIDVERRGTRIPESDLPLEVHALVHAINQALERLDEAHLRRERFLADAAHELRTPIAIMQTRIETAGPFPEQQKLLDDTGRLAELANQLLDIQRLTLAEPSFTKVQLDELAAGVVADLAPLAIARGYSLELDGPDKPVLALGDHGSLARALSNIVRNAISHSGNSGTIRVSVTAPATIRISDEGPGIPEADQRRIFEPFYRIKPSSEGAGLGLNLVQGIVQRHGGRLQVSHAANGGALFTITLPEFPVAIG